MLIQRALRPLLRKPVITSVRNFGAAPTNLADATKSINLYAVATLIIFPLNLAGVYYVMYVNPEDHTPPEYKPYTHLRIRTKAFPWGNGDQTLFHNKYTNATSNGYEADFSELKH